MSAVLRDGQGQWMRGGKGIRCVLVREPGLKVVILRRGVRPRERRYWDWLSSVGFVQLARKWLL
jgi:hypothetical protein